MKICIYNTEVGTYKPMTGLKLKKNSLRLSPSSLSVFTRNSKEEICFEFVTNDLDLGHLLSADTHVQPRYWLISDFSILQGRVGITDKKNSGEISSTYLGSFLARKTISSKSSCLSVLSLVSELPAKLHLCINISKVWVCVLVAEDG